MSENPLYDEKALLTHVAAGDESAFGQLFNRYWDNIYGVAYTLTRSRELARDMVQEIFIKVWLHKLELPQKDNFQNYLFIVARNHIYSELRRKSREEAFTSHLLAELQESPFRADDQTLYNDSAALIQQALATLPEQQRQVYELTRIYGLSQDEIAQRLQISKSTVKTHMSRALHAIRQFIETKSGMPLLAFFLFNHWR